MMQRIHNFNRIATLWCSRIFISRLRVRAFKGGTWAGFPLGKWQPSPATCTIPLKACHPFRFTLNSGNVIHRKQAALDIQPRARTVTQTSGKQLRGIGSHMAWSAITQYIYRAMGKVKHCILVVLVIIRLWVSMLCGLQNCRRRKGSRRQRPRPAPPTMLIPSEESHHNFVHRSLAPELSFRCCWRFKPWPVILLALVHFSEFPVQFPVSPFAPGPSRVIPPSVPRPCHYQSSHNSPRHLYVNSGLQCLGRGFALAAAEAGLGEEQGEEPTRNAPPILRRMMLEAPGKDEGEDVGGLALCL